MNNWFYTISLVLVLIGFASIGYWHYSATARLKELRTTLCERAIISCSEFSLDTLEEYQKEIFHWICEYSTALHPPFEEITKAYRLLSDEIDRRTYNQLITLTK